MLHNISPSIKQLAELNHAPFDFYLTGSRYFNRATPYSDWDFFALHTNDCETWLINHGYKFETQGSKYEGDPLMVAVYVSQGHMIHIQLVSDVNLKARAQHLIAHFMPYIAASKDQMRQVWGAAISAVKCLDAAHG